MFAVQVHAEMTEDSYNLVAIGNMTLEQIHLCGVHNLKL